MLEKNSNQPTCFFLAQRDFFLLSSIEETIMRAAFESGYKVVTSEHVYIEDSNMLDASITVADCIIADISEYNPNIFMGVGMALAKGKNLLLISNKKGIETGLSISSDLPILLYSEEKASISVFDRQIKANLRSFQRLSQSQATVIPPAPLEPFFLDWEMLTEREIENLCKELLSQMGFRKVEWGKGIKEFDLIAEFSRHDPDGFEFKELWLVSMGLNSPIEIILDMAATKPAYLIDRIMRRSIKFEESLGKYESNVTILIIMTAGKHPKELEYLRERIERRRYSDHSETGIRVRIWDQDYLTSLVQKFPNIGYKYFSDEGRIRSKTRRSYDELNKENSDLTSRQAVLIQQLEVEQNARVRAERDAVWKDISFSAAHKIGNPIFAIETDLDPLTKRIREARADEAEQVVGNIRSSIDKAKVFIEQFKSLARAQEITQTATLITPILTDSCKAAMNQGVECLIESPSEVEVYADPNRLAECFDELVFNATHWLDKPEKKIEIHVISSVPVPLPDFLDQSKKYLMVSFKDNGRGIPVGEKARIFEAFYTQDKHGTGLGLALVRRIIDGHGGSIIEIGEPGKGAEFEIYLPLPPDYDSSAPLPKSPRKSAAKKNKGK